MELVHQCSESGIRAFLIRGLGAERDSAERELLDAGLALPLPHRSLWTANTYPWKPLFLLMRDAHGRACGGFGIEQIRSRTMPGHAILQVQRFGGNLSPEACRVGLRAVTQWAHKEPRILRLQIHLFSLHRRAEIGEDLLEHGYRETSPPSSYRHTLAVDLRPSEESIFASFGKSARTRIRESMKKSLRSVPLEDPAFAARIEEQQREAVQRTGGRVASLNWEGVLRLSKERPDLSRVFGSFVGDDQAPEKMRAFAWACSHGDHVEYRAAGSSRSGDSRLPFGYILVWEMIRWAKSNGAEWFDMGGVTLNEESESALSGISDFKRFFSQNLIEVGAEWVLEPLPLRARIAKAVSKSAERVARLLR
jgi:Acetyltransferase (GNAT) domain